MIKIRDVNGNIVHLPGVRGKDGKSAYEYALEGGFVGTEEEFINLLINANNIVYEHMEDHTAHHDIRESISKVNEDFIIHLAISDKILSDHMVDPVSHADIRELIAKLQEGLENIIPYIDDAVSAHNIDITTHSDIRECISNLQDSVNNTNQEIVNVIQSHDSDNTAHNDIRESINNLQDDINTAIKSHNSDSAAHNDIRELIREVADNNNNELNHLELNKSDINHTHNYAGSSSAGGPADSAVKLESSAGDSSHPVYFLDGKPVACDNISGTGTNDAVTQVNTIENKNYRVLLSGTDDDETHTEGVNKSDLQYNPSTKELMVESIVFGGGAGRLSYDLNINAFVFDFA